MTLIYPADFMQKMSIPSAECGALPDNSEETFHQTIRIFLTIGQCFAIAPIEGISAPTASSLKFKILNLRMAFTVFGILTSFTMTAINFYWITLRDLRFESVVPLIFFSSNTFVMYSFIGVARKWPKLMKHWETVEMTTSIRDPHVHRQMRKIILSASIGIPIMSLLEHILSLANNVNSARTCNSTNDPMEAYFKQAFPGFFHFFGVNYYNGVSLQLLTFVCTFTWNFTDNFIIVVSLGLIAQFRHFNTHLERFKGMHLPDQFWGKQRSSFNKLLNLLHHVNKDFAMIILLSYSNNLFFICLQLFHSVTPSNSIIRSIYFWYSLLYLIGRTLLVSMTAALINDEAKKPIKVLQLVPTPGYQVEAHRFMEQLTTSTIALSGMQFFNITRKFLLSIIGTVITYELVLIQLQRPPDGENNPCERDW